MDEPANPVRSALERAVELGEFGVQAAAYRGDELVVDEWIGPADPETGRPVDGDTPFCLFSVSKAVTAIAVHVQADRGLVDYGAPIAEYWPEFGCQGKEAATVRHALTHMLGVPQMPDNTTPELVCDWERIVAEIALLEPVFAPGSQTSYLAMTFGWVLGEVVRRTDPLGRPFPQFVQEEVCAPLSIGGLWLGVPDEVLLRVAPVSIFGDSATWNYDDPEREVSDDPRLWSLRERALPRAVAPGPTVHNRDDIRKACLPATGGIGTARSVARLFAMLASGGELDGVRLLREQTVRSMLVPRDCPEVVDPVIGRVLPVGIGGMWLGGRNGSDIRVETGDNVLYHNGAGGTFVWADLDTGFAGAICHNRMFGSVVGRRETHPLLDLSRAMHGAAMIPTDRLV